MRPEIPDFLRHLSAERNDSPHTVKAYARDIEGFAAFLDGYYGKSDWKWAGVDRIAVRAYLADSARAGLSKRSMARARLNRDHAEIRRRDFICLGAWVEIGQLETPERDIARSVEAHDVLEGS